MEKYKEHFLMNVEDIKEYVVDEVKYFTSKENLEASEIGDGNINYVFIVKDKKTGKSLVVKQADKLLRASGRPLDLHRNKIEATILKLESELAPNFVPKIYHYSDSMFALSMEDISEYKNMRKELMNSKIFPNFAEEITDFIVDTLVPTSDIVMESKKKKEYVKLFINYDCCDISEDLVFTKPYGDYQGRNQNIISKGNEDFVKEYLYSDEKLHTEVAKLRYNFMNTTQALIHGDLHSGSIFINQSGIKVIDPEFAFYGPMGYDIGNVIGNLHFSLAYAGYKDKNNEEFINWIKETIVNVYDFTKQKLYKKFDELVRFPLYTYEFKNEFIDSIMSDTLGFAGTEIIRRTVGDSKVAELNTLELNDEKLKIERKLVKTGIALIMNRNNISSGKEILIKN